MRSLGSPVASSSTSLPIEASPLGPLPSDAQMCSDADESSPGPSMWMPLYSDIGNHPEIEKNVKLLLADRDYSLFDMPIMQLLSVLRLHSINTCEIRSADEAISLALDHIVNGKCFLRSSTGMACAALRRGIRDAQSMMVLATETILLEIDDVNRIRSVCFALGYTSLDLSKVTSLSNMKSLIELSRDNFSSCFSIPDILCNLDRMSASEIKILCRIHSVDVADLESMGITKWIDAAMSRLIMHFSMADCKFGDGSDRQGCVPKCKKSSTNNTFLKVSMLEAFLRKSNKHRVKLLWQLLSSLEIGYNRSDNARIMTNRLKEYTRSLRLGKNREFHAARKMIDRVQQRL